jgi:hypothetical protein
MTRHPRLSERFKRAFQHGPLLAAVAVAVLLNLNLIVGLLLKWMGIGASGHGIGLVVAHWGDAGWVITRQVIPVALFLALLRRRMKWLAAA